MAPPMRTSLLISYLSHIPIYATTGYAWILYKKLPRELRFFSWFLLVTAVLQFVSLLLALNGINNMPVLHVYVALSFSFLCWFYAEALRGFIDRGIIWGIGLLFLVFTIVNSLRFETVLTFNSNALSIESILVIILSLSTFILFLSDVVKERPRSPGSSLNWINSGLFIYYTSNLLIYYFGSIITSSFSKTFNLYTWVLHSFFSAVMYLCFFIGLWKRPKN